MKTLKQLIEDIDPKAQASANSILLIDKLKSNPQFMGLLQQIKLPTDKYNALIKFGEILGIPKERFNDFCQQQNNLTQ